ncbi:MAG: hypothetical protein LBI92_10165 [Azoarcus sp.]|jgi:hypothetical protein|nr:hypothetical protein [Azoarcus sp.]
MSAKPLSRLLACAFLAAALPAAAETEPAPPPSASEGNAAVAPTAPDAGDPTERMEALRDEASRLRDGADDTYQKAEETCYHKILVNSCIDNAKSARLELVRRARALEAEAYQLDLAERNRAAAEAAQRAEQHPPAVSAAEPTPDVAPPASRSGKAVERTLTRGGKIVAKSRNQTKARAEAARRAKTTRRDRERYDARIRELEEKKARDAEGR